MIFHVEQPELREIGLSRELGRVLGRARRKTAAGKLLFCLGLVTLAAGLFCVIGILSQLRELSGEGTAQVILTGLIINLLMVLLGLSWTGWGGTLNGFCMLWNLRRAKGDTRFYQDRLEDVDEGLCVSYQYQRIKTVFEGKRAFYLQVDQSRFMVLILQKKYFTLGQPDEFRRFMDRQCGKPVIAV